MQKLMAIDGKKEESDVSWLTRLILVPEKVKHDETCHFQRLKYGFFHLTRNWLLLYIITFANITYSCQYYIVCLKTIDPNEWKLYYILRDQFCALVGFEP